MTETTHEFQRLDNCFRTYTGNKFNLLYPTVDMINPVDISKALAYRPHFGGHTPQFFSVAQHCTLVVDLIYKDFGDRRPDLSFAGLMHDAEEAYTGDLIKPIKVHMPLFVEIADKIRKVIFEKYGIDEALLKEIKPYDIAAQALEYDQFYKNKINFQYLTPDNAQVSFLLAFEHYESLCRKQRKAAS